MYVRTSTNYCIKNKKVNNKKNKNYVSIVYSNIVFILFFVTLTNSKRYIENYYK